MHLEHNLTWLIVEKLNCRPPPTTKPTYLHICMYVCIVRMHICMHVCVYTYIEKDIPMYARMYACT